jgi:protein gp37
MQKTKIEYCDMTWNSIVKLEYLRHTVTEPLFKKKASVIAICPDEDIFVPDTPYDTIKEIIDTCKAAHWHTFMFLTKDPGAYFVFDFPTNCWLGTTITTSSPSDINRLSMMGLLRKKGYKTFVSIEPILSGGFDKWNMNEFVDKVIVGSQTGPGKVKPKQEWVDSIRHDNIFWKDSLRKALGYSTKEAYGTKFNGGKIIDFSKI